MPPGSSDSRRPAQSPRLDATKRKIAGWNAFADQLVGGIPPVQAVIWAVLYRHAVAGVVTRSNALLARDVGVSDKTIRRAVTALRRAGLLHVVQQGGMHVGASTYRLAVRNMKGDQSKPAADEPALAEPAAAVGGVAGPELVLEQASQPDSSGGHRWVSMAVTAMTDITDNRAARGPDGSPGPLEKV